MVWLKMVVWKETRILGRAEQGPCPVSNHCGFDDTSRLTGTSNAVGAIYSQAGAVLIPGIARKAKPGQLSARKSESDSDGNSTSSCTDKLSITHPTPLLKNDSDTDRGSCFSLTASESKSSLDSRRPKVSKSGSDSKLVGVASRRRGGSISSRRGSGAYQP